MDRREIARQLARYLLWIFLISSGATVCMIQLFYSGMGSSLESNQGKLLMSVAGVMWILPLTYCSITMFLNLSPKIRQSWLYSASSFFLLPLISIPMTSFKSDYMSADEIKNPLILTTIIYFLVLGYFFIKFFRQHNQKITQ
jgi:hypothetical protein